MPIKFACPKCKSVQTVDDKFAGKTGKCKCGNTIQVPMPTQKATAGAAATMSSLGGVFDELTDADYNRESPLKKIYEKAAITNEVHALRKFEGDDVKVARAKSGKLSAGLIFLGVLNIIYGIAALVGTALLFAIAAFASQAETVLPIVKAGLGVAAAILALFAVALFAGGVGLLLRKAWGWFLVAAFYTYSGVDRCITFAITLMEEFTQARFFMGMIPLFIALGFLMLIFKEDSRRICKVRSPIVTYAAAATGIIAAAAIFGSLYGMGLLGDQPPAAPPAGNGGY